MNVIARLFYWIGDLFAPSGGKASGSFARISRNEAGSAGPTGGSPDTKMATVSLYDAIRAYRRNSSDAKEQELAREVTGLAHTFDDWLCVADGVSSDSNLWQRALENLAATAVTFDQNAKVHELSVNPEAQSAALGKMTALASDIGEKLRVYEAAGPESVFGKAIFQEVTAGSKSCEEWTEILSSVNSGTPIANFVATKAIEAATTPEELANLACEDEIDDKPLELIVLERMRGFTASFSDWQIIASNYEGTVETVAREKMMESASTVEELLEIADEVSGDDDLEARLIERATQSSVWTDESSRRVLDDYDSDNVLYDVALKKLLATAHSTEDHLKIYFEWDFDEDEQGIILSSLSAIITPSERAIIAIVGEEGSELVEWAEGK